MAATGYVQVPADSTGKRVDAASLTDATVATYRQKIAVTGVSGTAEVVVVTNANAGANDYGMVVRHAGTALAAVTGTVNISGTALCAVTGTVNISGTVAVAAVAISGTATVAGTVSLGAGTANIGSINNISASVATAVKTIFASAAVPSATRGPRHVVASTSANATLIAAPGAGMAIFITSLAVSNASGSNTKARVGTSASIGQVTHMMAASGGGFVMQFTPPWMLSTNEACVASVKPNASEGLFNVHYYVASADAA